jgi:hypothetical protein
MIATTVIGCIVIALLIFVILLERRMREVQYSEYSTQILVPSSSVIISSKWYNLFRIPPDLARHGTGSICLFVKGNSTELTDVCIVLYGISKEPTTLYNATAIRNFILDEVIEFHIDLKDCGHMIAMRLDTSNPGSHMRMSDIVCTFIVR